MKKWLAGLSSALKLVNWRRFAGTIVFLGFALLVGSNTQICTTVGEQRACHTILA